jgi:hypothetical protein
MGGGGPWGAWRDVTGYRRGDPVVAVIAHLCCGQKVARTCIVSFRGLDRTPVRTMTYEFEDIVAEADDTDLLVPRPSWRSDFEFRAISKFLPGSTRASRVDPGFQVAEPSGSYDLLFTVLGFPREVLAFNSIPNWRRHCAKAVCVLRELWVLELEPHRGLVDQLNQFDHVFVEYAGTVEPLQSRLDVPVSFLAPSVDTELFCPLPWRPERSIYATNIGRRSSALHQLLLEGCSARGLFYNYTTVAPAVVWDGPDHRRFLAESLMRSRYSVMTRAKFDAIEQEEAGFRYFEGAAAGAVLVGQTVDNPEFPKLFDWPDAVLTASEPELMDLMLSLDEQPDRVDRIRRDNVSMSLLRHDCVHRWAEVLDAVGLDALPGLARRTERLKSLADEFVGAGPEARSNS